MFPAFYSLIGMAVGDAVGTTNEFNSLAVMSTLPLQTDMVGGGPFQLKKGQWTDDTAMALAMAVSIIKQQDIDLGDVSSQFKLWAQPVIIADNLPSFYSSNGLCFDIGGQTSNSILEFSTTGQPVSTFSKRAGGNGSMMRLAPVPMLLHRDPHMAIEFSGYSSLTTHNHGGAVDSCRYLGALIVGAIQGATKNELLSQPFVPKGLENNYWEKHPVCNEVLEVIMSSHDELVAPENSGGAVLALKAVLWHLKRANSFEEGVLNISNQGNDSDTVAAIFGQVAGPLFRSIRQDWIDVLSMSSFLQAVSMSLSVMAEHVAFTASTTQSSQFFMDSATEHIQNTHRDTYGKPGELQIRVRPILLEPIQLILQGYANLVISGASTPIPLLLPGDKLTNQLSARVIRDIWKSMKYWHTDTPLTDQESKNEPPTSNLIQLESVPKLPSKVFYTLLSAPSTLDIYRCAAGPVRCVFQLKSQMNPHVLSGFLFVTLLQLDVLVDTLEQNGVLSSCVDYTFHVVHANLKRYIDMSWIMRPDEEVDIEDVLRNSWQLLQGDVDVLAPFQSILHSFANIEDSQNLKENVFKVVSPSDAIIRIFTLPSAIGKFLVFRHCRHVEAGHCFFQAS